jgi:hypothetical protein
VLNRERLKGLLADLSPALAPLISQAIVSSLSRLGPAAVMFLRPMVVPPLIQSQISGALTAIDDLSDDECLALLSWIRAEIEIVIGERHPDEPYPYPLVAPAIAKLQQLLTR